MNNYQTIESNLLLETNMGNSRMLKRNNSRYWKTLLIIGIYYILPTIQFVIFQAHDSNVTCYYNFKCKKDYFNIPAFNNVLSNIFYVIYGLVFLVIVRVKEINNVIDKDYHLYYSLGLVLFLEGIGSALFHMCPSKLNFQFDTTFMFIGTSLMFLTIYQKRHRYNIPSPYHTYGFLSLVVFMNLLPLSGISSGIEIWFWSLTGFIFAYLMIFGSIFIYYGQEYDLDIDSFYTFLKKIRSLKLNDIPRFILLVFLNSFTLAMLIYGGINKPDFTMWMLSLFLTNMSIYFMYYLINKKIHKEYISITLWISLVIDLILFGLALYFFTLDVNNKLLTPEESKELNKPCVLFDYWDYHDIWHILSATGLFIFMLIVLYLDGNKDLSQAIIF